MKSDKVKSTIINQRAIIDAADLSLLNGIPEKINLEYLKNIQQIIVYNIAELARSGAEEIEVDIPMLGMLNISHTIQSTTKKNNGPSYNLNFTFKPSSIFARMVNRAFEDGDTPLPNMLSEKYGEKLLNLYEKYLEE